ncbi:Uncharacterised protein [uncultured archaeon]|nr:Uncharacterised protein [uncultured archaeon]
MRDGSYFGALNELDKEWNRLISKLRSPGERLHAVIKRVFGSRSVLVTKVAVEMMVAAFAFGLYQLYALKRLGSFRASVGYRIRAENEGNSRQRGAILAHNLCYPLGSALKSR